MSDNKPLMPLATAVWLVDNTALSFPQISQFCQLHELEVLVEKGQRKAERERKSKEKAEKLQSTIA